MLGTMCYDKNYENSQANNKLIAAYQKAYESYTAACERYEKLMTAYRVLKGISMDNPDENRDSLPHTEKIIKRMMDEAHKEKDVIADHARECIKHLRSLRYEM